MTALDGLGYGGSTAVVTGGSSGMGEATVRILSDLGAHVHVVDISEP
jgi:NAD(P)-dependent dehydrogenase (short-subunit alcohol dehydrogenase family)